MVLYFKFYLRLDIKQINSFNIFFILWLLYKVYFAGKRQKFFKFQSLWKINSCVGLIWSICILLLSLPNDKYYFKRLRQHCAYTHGQSAIASWIFTFIWTNPVSFIHFLIVWTNWVRRQLVLVIYTLFISVWLLIIYESHYMIGHERYLIISPNLYPISFLVASLFLLICTQKLAS